MKRDFLSLMDCTREELDQILSISARLKRDLKAGSRPPLLAGRTMAMIFEKPSLRTRTTFEIGMTQLGGYAVYLTPSDIQIGERETVADVARNLERIVDFIMARTFAHQTLLDLASHASVPVVNGLSDLLHPCQVLGDCLTLVERFGRLDGLKVAFLGDGNNVSHSWIEAAARFPLELVIACPAGYEPAAMLLESARQQGARVEVCRSPMDAANNADAIYTDVWTSMGQEDESERRRRHFAQYQVTTEIMQAAKPTAAFMHCLPAHRGEEVTTEVLEGTQSIVFDQAENRLHIQKGILVWLAQASYALSF